MLVYIYGSADLPKEDIQYITINLTNIATDIQQYKHGGGNASVSGNSSTAIVSNLISKYQNSASLIINKLANEADDVGADYKNIIEDTSKSLATISATKKNVAKTKNVDNKKSQGKLNKITKKVKTKSKTRNIRKNRQQFVKNKQNNHKRRLKTRARTSTSSSKNNQSRRGNGGVNNNVSANCSKPNYPRVAKQRRWQGRVIISFRINRSGHVENIKVIKSSGHSTLDKAAIKHVKTDCNFKPARKNGQAISKMVQKSVRYDLR